MFFRTQSRERTRNRFQIIPCYIKGEKAMNLRNSIVNLCYQWSQIYWCRSCASGCGRRLWIPYKRIWASNSPHSLFFPQKVIYHKFFRNNRSSPADPHFVCGYFSQWSVQSSVDCLGFCERTLLQAQSERHGVRLDQELHCHPNQIFWPGDSLAAIHIHPNPVIMAGIHYNTVSISMKKITKSYDGCGAPDTLIFFISSERVLEGGKLFTSGSRNTDRSAAVVDTLGLENAL